MWQLRFQTGFMSPKMNTNARNTGYGVRDHSRKRAKNAGKKYNSRANSIVNYNTARFNPRAFPLPAEFRTTLVYYEAISYTSVSTPQTYTFRGNGPYDPNQTGTGAQPVGFDNLSTFYTSIGVIASRVVVRVFNNTTQSIQFAIAPTMTSNQFGGYNEMQYFGSSVRTLTVDGTTRGGSSFGELRHVGVSTEVLGRPWDADFISSMTSTPTLQWYWILGFQSTDQATTISASVQWHIEYDVVYSGPKQVDLS